MVQFTHILRGEVLYMPWFDLKCFLAHLFEPGPKKAPITVTFDGAGIFASPILNCYSETSYFQGSVVQMI